MTRKQIEDKKKQLKSRIAANPSDYSSVQELTQLAFEVPSYDSSPSYDGGSSSGYDSGGSSCDSGGSCGCD